VALRISFAAFALAGCVTHRGDTWQHTPPEPSAAAGATLVLLGDAGRPGRTAAKVAERLEVTLAAEVAQGRTPVVLWLGNNVLPRHGRKRCADPRAAWSRDGVAELAAAVKGHASYALPGETEWRCGSVDAPGPWSRPSPHYVVRVGREGEHAVVLQCDAAGCERSPGPENPLADLVLVDIVPWIRTRSSPTSDPVLVALDHLVDALHESEAPRILVSHYPIEAAGWHGLGGGDPDSTIHTWPPRLVEAIEGGTFVGALAAHDRSSYVEADLSNATMRSDRVWLSRPVFQVVSGTASSPDARATSAYRRVRYATGIAYLPRVYTPRAGFALLRLGGSAAEAELHAGIGRQWQTARLPLLVYPPKARRLVDAPPMQPCLRCPEKPVPERP
jgi:hypothetical protein